MAAIGGIQAFLRASRALREPRPWLAPLSPAYAAAAALHRAWMRAEAFRVPPPAARPVPLVVIGSLRAGGSGKTSVVAELARRYRDRGLAVAVLVYRLGPGEPRPADPCLQEVRPGDDWRRFSEEAVLLAREGSARVFATRHRLRAWRALSSLPAGDGFDLILSDDGFQDPRLSGAFPVLLAAPGEAPGLFDLLPAGPYRETRRAAARARLVLAGPVRLPAARLGAPREPCLGNLADTSAADAPPAFGRRLLLPPELDLAAPWGVLCGLGDNRSFLADLAAAGVRARAVLEVPDHAAAPEPLLERLALRCAGAGILAARKDFLKLEAGAALRHRILPVDQEILLGDGCIRAIDAYREAIASAGNAGNAAGGRPGPGL